jgi:hypothetical protein
MLSEAVVTLSEAKGLFLRLRCFASLRVTVVAFGVTTITPVAFSIPHSAFRIHNSGAFAHGILLESVVS